MTETQTSVGLPRKSLNPQLEPRIKPEGILGRFSTCLNHSFFISSRSLKLRNKDKLTHIFDRLQIYTKSQNLIFCLSFIITIFALFPISILGNIIFAQDNMTIVTFSVPKFSIFVQCKLFKPRFRMRGRPCHESFQAWIMLLHIHVQALDNHPIKCQLNRL